jgi:hypothetical protein
MVLKLPNELIKEMAKFIFYKPLERGYYWSIKEHKISAAGPILSSFALSFFLCIKWREIKKKRHEMLNRIVNQINLEKRNGLSFLMIRYLELKIGWYWDKPRENENILCIFCLKWEKYEKENFQNCPNSIHFFHKECSREYSELFFEDDPDNWTECHICKPFGFL